MTAESTRATELLDFPIIPGVFDEYFQDFGACFERIPKLQSSFHQERLRGISSFATMKFAR
jgi:hypothetical protein